MRLEEAVANEKLATEKGKDSNAATGPLRTPGKKVVAGVKSLTALARKGCHLRLCFVW